MCQIFPDAVRANTRAPSAEYQTRSIGPPAGDARERSTTVLPTRRQSSVGVDCAQAPAMDAAARISTVALRHTNESILTRTCARPVFKYLTNKGLRPFFAIGPVFAMQF